MTSRFFFEELYKKKSIQLPLTETEKAMELCRS